MSNCKRRVSIPSPQEIDPCDGTKYPTECVIESNALVNLGLPENSSQQEINLKLDTVVYNLSNSIQIPVQDEGVEIVTAPSAFNFVGNAVSVSDSNGVATITISTVTESSDYISEVELTGQNLVFTGIGDGFSGSVDFSPFTILEEVSPLNVALGTRLQSVAQTNGFYVRSSSNGFNGYTANLTGTGASAYVGIDLINQGGTFTDATTLMHYSSGYTETELQNNGGLFFTNDMYFTGNRDTSKMIFQLGNQAVSSNSQTLQDNVLELLANREVNFPNLTTTIIDTESTGRTAVTREWIEAQSFESTGFEAIDEGNGLGLVRIGRNPVNYGNIGLNAIEYVHSTAVSSLIGATGNRSTAIGGYNNIASTFESAVIGGYLNNASGTSSIILGGASNTASNADSAILGGQENTTQGNSAVIIGGNENIINANGTRGVILGGDLNVLNGTNSIVGGLRSTAFSFNETVFGSLATDYTPNSNSSWNDADRLFVIGNGYMDGANPIKRDAIIIRKDGLITAPSVTNTLIDNSGTGKELVTVDWFNANNSGGGTSYAEWATYTGTRVGGDLVVTLGDYDDSGSGTKLIIDDVNAELVSNIYRANSLFIIDSNGALRLNNPSGGSSSNIRSTATGAAAFFDLPNVVGTNILPISVNGNTADAVGNITVATGSVTKYTETFGDGVATTFNITHNLGTRSLVFSLFNITTGEYDQGDYTYVDDNTTTISFNTAPTTNQYEITII